MLRNSNFESEELEREKGVILEEMNMYYDTPRDYVGVGVRRAPLRLQSARLGDARHPARRSTPPRAKRSSTTSTSGTRRQRMVVGVAGKVGDGLPAEARRAAGRHVGQRQRCARAGRPAAGEGVAGGAWAARKSDQANICVGVPSVSLHASGPLRAADAGGRSSARACRRGSSSRCVSSVASPTTSTR